MFSKSAYLNALRNFYLILNFILKFGFKLGFGVTLFSWIKFGEFNTKDLSYPAFSEARGQGFTYNFGQRRSAVVSQSSIPNLD